MTQVAEKVDHAIENAKGWYASIEEMLADLAKASDDGDTNAVDSATQTIQESVLSVLVRDGWHTPGSPAEDGAEEYEILLTTGGPALRIYGKINQYDEAETAELQVQDWFKPWTPYLDGIKEQTLLDFTRHFYFG